MERCKMLVTRVTHMSCAYGPGTIHESWEVELYPALGGSTRLSIIDPEAAKQFEVGETYFVDFTRAPATEAEESK